MPETEREASKLTQMKRGTLGREITLEEIVDTAFDLKSNTASGSDWILSSDIQVPLETNIPSENWKNVEIINFVHKVIKNVWDEEKVPEGLKEVIIRPFLKNADMDA